MIYNPATKSKTFGARPDDTQGKAAGTSAMFQFRKKRLIGQQNTHNEDKDS